MAEQASHVQIPKDVGDRHAPQANFVLVFARQIAMRALAVKRGGAGFGEIGRFRRKGGRTRKSDSLRHADGKFSR